MPAARTVASITATAMELPAALHAAASALGVLKALARTVPVEKTTAFPGESDQMPPPAVQLTRPRAAFPNFPVAVPSGKVGTQQLRAARLGGMPCVSPFCGTRGRTILARPGPIPAHKL